MNPHLVYLVQTDTTVGFLSQNAQSLVETKQRPVGKSFIIGVDSFQSLKHMTRVPKLFQKVVRRAKKTTFAYSSGLAIRVVRDEAHLPFLTKVQWCYSTSSNPSGKGFDEAFAISKADVIVFTCKGFFEAKPSTIIKLGKSKIKKVR